MEGGKKCCGQVAARHSCRNVEQPRWYSIGLSLYAAAMSQPEPQSDPSNDSDRLMKSLETESDDLWKQHPVAAVLTLTLPIWLTTFALVAAWLFGGRLLVRKLLVAATASAAAGRFIILGGDSGDQPAGFSHIQLALLVFYLDTIWAVVLTWHAGALFHLPWLGKRLKSAVHEGNQLLRHNRWMRRVTVGAVLAFVMLPVSSTGSIGGSLLGRLLGLSRKGTLIIVLIGSVLGCAVMYAGAAALGRYISGSNPVVRYGGIAIVVLMLYVLTQRYRRTLAD